MKYTVKEEQQLMNDILSPLLIDNLEDFVKFIYPWGQPGTPLEHHKGPRDWQLELLQEVTLHIKNNKNAMLQNLPPEVFQEATSSGRGIGKSAILAWIDHWFRSTRIGGTCVVTANTESQLTSRTWPEFGKWLTMALNSHWFEKTSTSIRPQQWFQSLIKDELNIDSSYYYSQAQSWSEENPDAFAGVHNPHGIMVLYDEASGIPFPIWNVTEGFFTEPVLDRYWLVFSNPRRPSGAFFECFHKNRDFWRRRHIDARTVEGTDLKVYEKIIKQNGEDSDVARVEVKGEFPSQGVNQFFNRDIVRRAQTRNVSPDKYAALIMGVDIARGGPNKTVIRFRQGRDARSIKPVKLRGYDNMQVAYKVAELIEKYNPDAVNIDAGAGSGVIDRLRELGYKVNEIWFGATTTKESPYFNKRTDMYGKARDWLEFGAIDDDKDLEDDLLGLEYIFAGRDGDKMALESKKEMEKRGLASPDDGDAFVLTFAVPVARRNLYLNRHRNSRKVAKDVDYDVFGL